MLSFVRGSVATENEAQISGLTGELVAWVAISQCNRDTRIGWLYVRGTDKSSNSPGSAENIRDMITAMPYV